MTTMTHSDSTAAPHTAAPRTRGVHHLALTTEDMRMTMDFYVGVLGMPLIHAMKVPPGLGKGSGNRGNPPFENLRHYFFDMGGDGLLAFFEIPRGARPAADRDAIGGMQHVAFTTTSAEFDALRERLREAGVETRGPIETLPGVFSLYFFDPNGIRLEACHQPADGTDVGVVARNTQSGPHAREELQSLGAGDDWVAAMTAHLPGG